MLLPPDLRDWVAEDDLVHFVLEAVEGMNLKTLKVNRRGTGDAQYPPKTMLALLIYCYANGIFSSRRIERATYRDVAVRYLMADEHPDHDTICTFRRENLDVISEAFVQVLQLARQLKVLKVGMVSVDGTHLRASASKDKNVRYDRAGQLEAQLAADIEGLLAEAEQADTQAETDGQTLPKEIARRETLRRKMAEAREELERRARRKAAVAQEEYDRKHRNWRDRGGSGTKPKPPRETPKDRDQANLTDSDSRLMRKSKRHAYEQAYNAQAVVDADGSMLILGGHVSQCPNDSQELEPALADVSDAAGTITTVLADTGYVNVEMMKAVERSNKDLYVPVNREGNHTRRRYDYRPLPSPPKRSSPVKDPYLIKMQSKMQSDAGRSKYKLRQQTVEPVFGIIKHAMGFRQFLLRGLRNVTGEWTLVSLAYNIRRLWTLKTTC